MAIVLRTTKGTALTYAEMDGNFTDLNLRVQTIENDIATRFSGDYEDLLNKPALFSGSFFDLTDTPTIPSVLADLTNVATTVPTNGQVLKWNGSAWAPANDISQGGDFTDAATLAGEEPSYYLDYNNFINTPAAFSGSYTDLTDKPVLFSGSYNDLADLPSVPVNLSDLANVSTTAPTSGQVLKWNGVEWAPSADIQGSATGGIALSDLSVTVAPAGTANLAYNDTTGVFTYTPPDLSSFITAETDTLSTVLARGNTASSNINMNGSSITDIAQLNSAGSTHSIDLGSTSDLTLTSTRTIGISSSVSVSLSSQSVDLTNANIDFNGATINNFSINSLTPSGTGSLALDSASTIDMTAPDGVTISDVLTLGVLSAAPSAPAEGMIAIADGTTWNPLGNGLKSMVVYLDSAWRQIAVGSGV